MLAGDEGMQGPRMSPNRRHEVDLAVIGGGLSGLAAANTAGRLGASALVLEAADEPGGLVRSVRTEGYTFDYSGHLLHLARPETRALIEGVTSKSDWLEKERHSSIIMRDRWVPYPFQLHLAHAPEDIRDECLAELPDAAADFGSDPTEVNFGEWIERSLGTGIGRHFMVPYNEKLSTVPVGELTCEWLGRFVPRPSLEEIREGGESDRVLDMGYNKRFLYPRAGGIDTLWRSLARDVDVRTGAEVVTVEPERRLVTLRSGEQVRYRHGLVASTGLRAMTQMVQPASPALTLGGHLRANEVTCVNLGLRQLEPRFRETQWLYLPEPRFHAYRLGFYNRFSEAMSPPGREGVYVEIAHRGPLAERDAVDRAIADLVELGAIRTRDDVEVAVPLPMPSAYVIHDRQCSWARGRIHDELERRGISMVGRYGRWEYAAMEDALWQGIEAAERTLAGRDAELAS
jgi:protoporphyrinogen oxidase